MTLATPIHELANLSDIATIIASIIGTISLIIAATSIRLQYKSSENQFKLNNLIEYTKRYSSIIDRMPVNVYDWDFDASSIENEHERNELKKHFTVILNSPLKSGHFGKMDVSIATFGKYGAEE